MKNLPQIVRIGLTVGIILAAACTKGETGWQGEIEEENGTTVIKNPEEPLYPEEIFSYEEELTIGEKEDRQPLFQGLSGIEVDSEGMIFILDGMAAQVFVFDQDGVYLRKFGRKGQGPGEFQIPVSIHLIEDNRLIIFDRANARLSFFSKAGELLKEISTAHLSRLFRIVPLSDESFVAWSNYRREKTVHELQLCDSGLEPVKLLVRKEWPRNPDVLEIHGPSITFLTLHDGSFLWGEDYFYQLNFIDRDGRTFKKIVKDHQPVKITEEDKEFILRDIFGGMGNPSSRKVEFPDNYPPLRRFQEDENGRIFVLTRDPLEMEKNVYDVFGPDGKFLTRLLLDVHPQMFKRDKFYTIEEDEEGFQLVKRYAVRWDY